MTIILYYIKHYDCIILIFTWVLYQVIVFIIFLEFFFHFIKLIEFYYDCIHGDDTMTVLYYIIYDDFILSNYTW